VVYDGPRHERPENAVPDQPPDPWVESPGTAKEVPGIDLVYEDPSGRFWRRYTRSPDELKPWEMSAGAFVVKRAVLPVLGADVDDIARLAGAVLADARILRSMVKKGSQFESCFSIADHVRTMSSALEHLLLEESAQYGRGAERCAEEGWKDPQVRSGSRGGSAGGGAQGAGQEGATPERKYRSAEAVPEAAGSSGALHIVGLGLASEEQAEASFWR